MRDRAGAPQPPSRPGTTPATCGTYTAPAMLGGVQVYVSVDMEGVAGVATRAQVVPDGGEAYLRACRLMTLEANAAVAGAFAGGARRVLVNDAHGSMANIDAELLDPRAELCIGSPKPWSMLAGITEEMAVALFVGYHGGAGSAPAVLDHTFSPRVFRAIRVDGVRQTETTLNAGLAGSLGVPVGLVTGDEATCHEARAALGPDVPTVAVKAAIGAEAAYGLHPSIARERIEAGAREAMGRAAAGHLAAVEQTGPLSLECDVTTTLVADHCATIPGVDRPAGRTLRFEAADWPEVMRCILTMALVGRVITT